MVILVDKKVLRYLGDQKFYNGFVSQKEKGDKMEMTFLTASLPGFARWYLLFADHAVIAAPRDLTTIVRDIIAAISKKIK